MLRSLRSALKKPHLAADQERAHQALIESEQQFRLAASSAPLVLYARDRDLRLTWVYSRRTDTDFAENLGKTIDQVVHPEDARILDELYRDVMRTGQPRQQLMRFHYSRLLDAPWQNLHIQPHRNERGEIIGVICAAYDVTELMEARARLAEREALLQLALEVGEMGAWEYDPHTSTVRYSGSLARIAGLPHGDHTSIEQFLGAIHPDDRTRVREQVDAALAEHGALDVEHRVLRPDGKIVWVIMRAQVLNAETPGEQRLTGVTIDVTQEHELRERLERSNSALRGFARSVAHDLKTPLSAMMGYGQILERTLRDRLNPSEHDKLRFMLSSGQQLGELIDGILAYSHAIHEPVRVRVDLEQALAQAAQRLRLEIELSAAELTHDPLPAVEGNPALLTQILQNLIGNALKYRDRSRTLRIHVGVAQDPSGWVIHVRDNGIGIDPAHHARLFEAFERAHAEDSYAGLGLGLALVRDAVAHHGGRVWLHSAPGHGSTFSFSLPTR